MGERGGAGSGVVGCVGDCGDGEDVGTGCRTS